MSSTEPPAGSTPPPGEPTPPPPEMPANPATVPPPDQSMAPPPPPPPPAGAAAPMPGAPGAAYGPGQPGNLLDRFLARLIDGVILGIVFAIINAVVAAIVYNGYHSNGEVWLYYTVTGVIEAIIGLGYFGYMESSRGQTVGKQVMKLHTYGPDGHSNPTMEQACRRNIYWAFPIIGIVPVVGWIIYPLLALGALILILVGINGDTVKRQHWFDKFAGGTQVVKVG